MLRFMFKRIRSFLIYITEILFELIYRNKGKKVPPVRNKLLFESGISLAEKIRNGNVTSVEVVQAFIDRCKEVNGLLNAIVEDRFEEAIKEARKVDEYLKTVRDRQGLKKTKPFLGVPFTTKEGNEVKGMKHTMGMIARKDHVSFQDSTAIALMKEAGGIVIAKTNIPEMNAWLESRNNLYGHTNNPYNTTRTVGGTSGGEGAIAAACGSAISIGSDIGGSIRIPAAFNGIFGHKPSEGLTNVKGLGIRHEDTKNTMMTCGPMCKKAEDLIPILKVLIGGRNSKVNLDAPVDVAKLKVFFQLYSGDESTSVVREDIKLVILRAVNYFHSLNGGRKQEVEIPGMEYSFRIWRYWMTQEEEDMKVFKKEHPGVLGGPYLEVFKKLIFRSSLTLALVLRRLDVEAMRQDDAEWIKDLTTKMREFILEILGEDGVLFMPSYPTPAPYHYLPYFKFFDLGYCGIFNVLKLPACHVPMGLNRQGLPVGFQVVSAPYKDHLCIAVAKELERVYGGWVPPS